MSFSAYRKSLLRSVTAVAVLGLSGLTGCTQVYDDTKGWANGVEAWVRQDILESAPSIAQEEKRPGNVRSAARASSAPRLMATSAADQTTAPVDKAELYPQTEGKPAASTSDSKKKLASAPVEAPGKPQLAAAGPAVASKSPGLRLHLSSNGSKKAAEQEWNQLAAAFPAQLDGLELQVERADLGKKGVFFRVLAGPLQDKAAAQKICSQLKEKRQYCALIPARRPAPLPAAAAHAKG